MKNSTVSEYPSKSRTKQAKAPSKQQCKTQGNIHNYNLMHSFHFIVCMRLYVCPSALPFAHIHIQIHVHICMLLAYGHAKEFGINTTVAVDLVTPYHCLLPCLNILSPCLGFLGARLGCGGASSYATNYLRGCSTSMLSLHSRNSISTCPRVHNHLLHDFKRHGVGAFMHKRHFEPFCALPTCNFVYAR